MPISENLLNSAIVKREIKAPPPTVYEDDYGLPFYYTMDFSFAA